MFCQVLRFSYRNFDQRCNEILESLIERTWLVLFQKPTKLLDLCSCPLFDQVYFFLNGRLDLITWISWWGVRIRSFQKNWTSWCQRLWWWKSWCQDLLCWSWCQSCCGSFFSCIWQFAAVENHFGLAEIGNGVSETVLRPAPVHCKDRVDDNNDEDVNC